MNQRVHDRMPADFEVRVTNLSKPDVVEQAWLMDVSSTGAALLMRSRFDVGDMIRMNVTDAELFGHVIYVDMQGQLYRTGIEVEQVLLGRSDLAKLVEQIGTDPGVAERAKQS